MEGTCKKAPFIFKDIGMNIHYYQIMAYDETDGIIFH